MACKHVNETKEKSKERLQGDPLYAVLRSIPLEESNNDSSQSYSPKNEKKVCSNRYILSDDPYGIRTRVTAVKGRCLNHLTNGPMAEKEGFEPSRRLPDLHP